MLNVDNFYYYALKQEYKDDDKARYYLNKYVNFIQARINRHLEYKATINNTEKHHIIPKKWGGSNEAANIVILTVAEHVVAHHLLARTTNRYMIFAFNQLANRSISQFNYNVTLRLVTEARKEYIKLVSKPVIDLNTGQIYSSATDASTILGCTSGGISGACRNHYKCCGHYWAYISDMPDINQQSCNYRIQQYRFQTQQKKHAASRAKQKKVVELDTGVVYESVASAAKQHNTAREIIATAARLKQ